MKIKPFITAVLVLSNGIYLFGQADKFKSIDSLLAPRTQADALKAITLLETRQQKDSTEAGYWFRYAKANFIYGKQNDAKKYIARAIQMDGNNGEYYFEKGLFHNELGETAEALSALEKAVAHQPEGKYYYWKGIINHQLRNIDNAEKDYRAAIDKNFESAELFNNLSIILFEKGNYQESLQAINKGLTLNANYVQAISAKAKIHFFLLNIDSACAGSAIALSRGYKNAFALPDSICQGTETKKIQFAADIFASNKFYKLAIEPYSRLIANGSTNQANYLNRGYCYYNVKDYANAEKDYLKALTLANPETDLLYENLSLLYLDMGDMQKSMECANKRIALNPNNHRPYVDRGICYRRLKKYKEAEADFDKSLSLKPDFFRALGHRAYLYFELGKNDKALEDASQSVRLNSKYGYGYLVLGLAKQKLKADGFCLDFYYAQKYGDDDAERAIKAYCK